MVVIADVVVRITDYSSVITRVMEMITENEVDASQNKVLSRLKKIPAGMLKTTVNYLPKHIQNDLAMTFFDRNKNKMADKINEWIHEEDIQAYIKEIKIVRDDPNQVFHIKVFVESVDYEAVAAKYLPRMIDMVDVAFEDSEHVAFQIFKILKKAPPSVFTDFVSSLPDEIKNELTVYLAALYEKEMIVMLHRIAVREKIQLKIDRIRLL